LDAAVAERIPVSLEAFENRFVAKPESEVEVIDENEEDWLGLPDLTPPATP
jgi:hypothetical protein